MAQVPPHSRDSYSSVDDLSDEAELELEEESFAQPDPFAAGSRHDYAVAADANVELDPAFSVDSLLSITGEHENWGIEDHAKQLKKIATENIQVVDLSQFRAPAIFAPTAADLGGSKVGSLPGGRPPVGRGRAESVPPPPPKRRGPSTKENEGSETRPGVAKPAIELDVLADLSELLAARLAVLEKSGDTVGMARAHGELSVVAELNDDDVRANYHADAALKIDALFRIAHWQTRLRSRGRSELGSMLEHLAREIEVGGDEPLTTELLAERARLLDGAGEDPSVVRQAWERTLARAPGHAAALRGLEGELWSATVTGTPVAFEALATHLARLADAYAAQPELAAWLHVERAKILEKNLDRDEEARAALERAVALDPSVGPVRHALSLFLATVDDAATLVALLDEEAQLEHQPHRSAQLELDAAILANERTGDINHATSLLERASARAPTVPAVDRRVLDELVGHYETLGRWDDAIKARRARLVFLTDRDVRYFELQRLASLSEKLGDVGTAIQFLLAAYELDQNDPKLIETLDRLYTLSEQDPERIRLWLDEAARRVGEPRASESFRRAALIADQMDERPLALKHLEVSLSLRPDDSETVDLLARLMAPAPSGELDGEVRALLDLYTQATLAATDPARKVAYLEKSALLWEDVIGEPRRALRAYQEILALEPDRRSAILGLARNTGRVGDHRGVAQALLAEAQLAGDVADALQLRVRAAKELELVDHERAQRLVAEVLAQDPSHDMARELEGRLHETAGRHELAARSLRARIEHTPSKDDKVKYHLALAHIEEANLGSPAQALESLRAARELDPAHLAPPEEIARILTTLGDHVALRAALEDLSATATRPEERARFLVRAAEIEEFRTGDDGQSARLYVQALVEMPDDALIADRLARVLARKAKRAAMREAGSTRVPTVGLGERITLAGKRLERTQDPELRVGHAFHLAELLIELGQDIPRAVVLLEDILAAEPSHVPALRTLESLSRRQSAWSQLGRVLSLQGTALLDARARLGALWSLASIQEWHLSERDTYETYERILSLDPTDHGALEAVVRQKMDAARKGDPSARGAVLSALRAFASVAYEDSTRVVLEVELALLLERWGSSSQDLIQEALERFSAALTVDPGSVTAATGLARLGNLLADAHAAVAAAVALAELARPEPKTRARYLTDAATLLLAPSNDSRLGSIESRCKRAGVLLEEALMVDADAVPAAGALSTLRQEAGDYAGLVAIFRDALTRATTEEAVRTLGTEIAVVSRDKLQNIPLAIDAMKRVRLASHEHSPSLLTLAELYITERTWPEAIEVLEAVAALPDDAASRLTALFALARIYEKIAIDLPAAERSLRLAVELDEKGPRALRALLHRLASKAGETVEGVTPPDHRSEIADLLERLSHVEPDDYSKADVLLELAELRQQLGEVGEAERALVEAAARAPNNEATLLRLRKFFHIDRSRGEDAASYAQAVGAVLKRGHELGHTEARWFAELGNVEIDKLGRVRDGINHLTQAIRQNRELYQARFQLANALARSGSNEEASRVLMEMIVPEARPLLAIDKPGQALDLLERIMGAERRPEEAIVVSELRAIIGDLDEGRHRWLRNRELAPFEGHHAPLDRATLITHAAPREAGHALLEVAAALSGTESKMLRSDLSEIGIGARDRVGARSGHPTRQLLDRLCRALGIGNVELVVTAQVTRTRVFVQDEPWIIVPKRLTELPEQSQIASLARALAKVALCVPWLEELPPPHIEAYLLAAARQGYAHYGEHEIDVITKRLVAQYEPAVAKALSRRSKRALEDLAPRLAKPESAPVLIDDLMAAVARTELRIAYVLTGDLLSTVDELRALDPGFLSQTETPGVVALRAVLEHPYAGDVVRFAMTREATALRRRVGATWTN